MSSGARFPVGRVDRAWPEPEPAPHPGSLRDDLSLAPGLTPPFSASHNPTVGRMNVSPLPSVVPIIASAPDAIPALPPAPPAPPPTAASVPTPTSAPAPPPLPTPSIPPPRLTSFSTIGYLNAKHVSSNFVKQDNQSFQARRRTDADWEREELAKRRRLVGEEGIEEAERKEEGGERVEIGNVLIKGEGKRVEPKAKAAVDNEDDSEVSLTTSRA